MSIKRKFEFVQGATNKERWQLQDDGAPVNGDQLNAPELRLKDKNGQAVTTTNAVAWASAVDGTIDVDMEVLALTAALSPYRARFWLTDQAGDLAPYPNDGEADQWTVHPA